MTPDEHAVACELARVDLYAFSRLMFLARRGFKWQRATHHKVICSALMRVYRGECKRLIINIPPRYSKTELAVVNFMSWALGRNPDAEFIHSSYSSRLAASNAWQARELVTHEAYREIFPGLELRQDSKARDEWRTTVGGCVYAVGAGGTITGYGAGKMRPEFGGCFPVGTRVWTECGLIPIDRIVRERMAVNVWSFDYEGRMVLRPVTAWHENPPNEIVRVSFDDGATVECTPDHKFWTQNRGWVRADSLGEDDRLPRVCGGIESFNNIGINAKSGGSRLDAPAVLAPGSGGFVGERDVSLLLGQDGAEIGGHASVARDIRPACDGFPSLTAPNLVNDSDGNSVFAGNFSGGDAYGVVNCQSLFVGKNGDRVAIGFAERPVGLTINDVGASSVVSQVGKGVIDRAPVRMAAVKTLRTQVNERQQNEAVNGPVFDLGPDGQTDAQMSASEHGRFENFAGKRVTGAGSAIRDGSWFASDAPEVADGIEPFISGDRKPVLVQYVRHDDATFCLMVEEYHNFTVEQGLVVKNCIILDDMHKPDEVRSDVMRKGVIEWFQNTLESRKNSPETPIILIMQRLHEEDLAGWLLAGGNGEQWESIVLPAIQSDGSALWTEKHTIDELRRMQDSAPYTFSGQYMQRPTPLEGGIFKPDEIVPIDAPKDVISWVRAWDLAASHDDGDWTVGALIGRTATRRYVVGDIVRLRGRPDEVEKAIVNTAGVDGRKVKISLPQDPGQAGKAQIAYLTKSLSGFTVMSSPETGDKITRAEPFASQVNVGNVDMVRAEWNGPLLSEMRNFPNGKFDDQIDAMSRGFNEVSSARPLMITDAVLKRSSIGARR